MSKRKGPGKYHEWLTKEGLIKIEGWARDGFTDEQISHNMGIHPSTLYDWKDKYPDISESLKRGKEVIDRQVENALLKRALGYEYEEVKQIREKDDYGKDRVRVEKTVRQVTPDTTAQIFWLKNRKPEDWRKKTAKEYRAEDLQLEKMAVEIERQKAEIERLKSLLEPATTSERLMVDYIDKLERVLADG